MVGAVVRSQTITLNTLVVIVTCVQTYIMLVHCTVAPGMGNLQRGRSTSCTFPFLFLYTFPSLLDMSPLPPLSSLPLSHPSSPLPIVSPPRSLEWRGVHLWFQINPKCQFYRNFKPEVNIIFKQVSPLVDGVVIKVLCLFMYFNVFWFTM